VGLGVLVGSLLSFRQVGSVCGALLTNVAAWLSGTWFSLDLLGKGFKTFAYCLPFANAVDAARAALSGDFWEACAHIWIVCAYAFVACIGAVLIFRKKMKT
jgi:ABC-2 type transport system permease protein